MYTRGMCLEAIALNLRMSYQSGDEVAAEEDRHVRVVVGATCSGVIRMAEVRYAGSLPN